jgi:protein arginine kinase activator
VDDDAVLAGAAPGGIDNGEDRCPRCGLSRRELYTQGRMGCDRCYEIFDEEVARALREIHGEDQHIGKP